MELTLAEVQDLLEISRYQVSRYAKDGRLQRTRQGHYEAASLASLHPPFDRYAHMGRGRNTAEERAVWLVRAEHAFRRDLLRIVADRHRNEHRGYGRREPSPGERQDIDKAVRAYVATLAAMPER